MAKRMLIDAAHPEETRVVVTSGTRLEEFDFESSTKKQVKGNIYLAKVTRVEPSLQATFVDYAGNRHGFLAFSEIHPDYYRIPVSDRRPGEPEPEPREAPLSGNGAAEPENGWDDGVPLAAALPEPVPVGAPAPESASEPDDDARDEPEASDEPPSERADDDVRPWDEPARDPDAIALRAAEESLLATEAAENGEYAADGNGAAVAEIVETLGGDEV